MVSLASPFRSNLHRLLAEMGFHVRVTTTTRPQANFVGCAALSSIASLRNYSTVFRSMSSQHDFRRTRSMLPTNTNGSTDHLKFKSKKLPSSQLWNSNNRNIYTGVEDKNFLFRQLLEYKSYTYTYLLADLESNEAILIDPVIETVDRDVRIANDLGLQLIYAANTHVHADHITGTGELKKRVPSCKSMIAAVSGARADVQLNQGDKISFGRFELEVRSTPGHTDGCLTFVFHEKAMVFTGDALLIRGCGRTDFQQGSASKLYDSVHKQIFSLPQNYMVFPAHDYLGQTMSTIGEELRYNPRLTKPKNQFVEIMEKLHLPYPKQIDIALPANLVCGIYDDNGKLVT